MTTILFALSIAYSVFLIFILVVTVGIFRPLRQLWQRKQRRLILGLLTLFFILSTLTLQGILGTLQPADWIQSIFTVFLLYSFAYAIFGVQSKSNYA